MNEGSANLVEEMDEPTVDADAPIEVAPKPAKKPAGNILRVKRYKEATRQIVFVLSGGFLMDSVYYESYQTKAMLDRLDAKVEEGESNIAGLGGINPVLDALAFHLSIALKSFKIMDEDDRLLPTETQEDRYQALRENVAFYDLQRMVNQITEDVRRPLEREEKS